jgi:hypothetical protein
MRKNAGIGCGLGLSWPNKREEYMREGEKRGYSFYQLHWPIKATLVRSTQHQDRVVQANEC